jgi:hypothetical protein
MVKNLHCILDINGFLKCGHYFSVKIGASIEKIHQMMIFCVILLSLRLGLYNEQNYD